MGKLTQALGTHARIGLDSCVFIYHLERHPGYLAATQELLTGVESGRWEAITSTITLMELTVRPWRLERSDVAWDYEGALVQFPHLRLMDVTRGVAREAAQLRARHNLRPADAILAATALIHDATVLVTNDRDFSRLDALDVLLLSDVVE